MGILEAGAGYFMRGGLCMWPLLLCSLAVIFLAVERCIYYRQKISKTEFAVEFCKKMTRGQAEDAYNLATSSEGCAAKLAKDILEEKEHLGASLESVAYEKADRYSNELGD